MTQSLATVVQKTIESFTKLTIGNVTIPCLYFNNKRQQVRAGLRVSIGKGSPKEIREEVKILAQKEGLNLKTMDEDMVRMFLKKHNIGIDCSAFAYYVLDALLRDTKETPLKKALSFPYAKSPLRKLLVRLRSVENTNVLTLAHEKNSTEVPLQDVKPGDMITILEGGEQTDWYHVMIVTDVTSEKDTPTAITYTHSYQWSTDGQYNHGVRTGTIEISNVHEPLLAQTWTELGKTGTENETFRRAQSANQVTLRRLNTLV